jgi:CheY-like chemotaxis protein
MHLRGTQIMDCRNSNLSILIMDDDEDVRFIADLMLQRLGFSVVTATCGAETIDLYRAAMAKGQPFSAVILDISIPGSMGGGEVLRQLQTIDPLVNAFISSGNPVDPMMTAPKSFGFAGAIPKPFSTETLRNMLVSALTGLHAPRE